MALQRNALLLALNLLAVCLPVVAQGQEAPALLAARQPRRVPSSANSDPLAGDGCQGRLPDCRGHGTRGQPGGEDDPLQADSHEGPGYSSLHYGTEEA